MYIPTYMYIYASLRNLADKIHRISVKVIKSFNSAIYYLSEISLIN